MAQDLIDVAEAGDLFSSIVSSLLSTCNPTPSRPCGGSSGPHCPRSTDKLLANLAEKNTARKQFQSDPGSAVRVHNRCLKASRKSAFHRSALKQEKAFRSNPGSCLSLCAAQSRLLNHHLLALSALSTSSTYLAQTVVPPTLVSLPG